MKCVIFTAPTVGESSDESDNDTSWRHTASSDIIGSESGVGTPASATYIPGTCGPFSALVPTMWPQDILARIQQVFFVDLYYEQRWVGS